VHFDCRFGIKRSLELEIGFVFFCQTYVPLRMKTAPIIPQGCLVGGFEIKQVFSVPLGTPGEITIIEFQKDLF
jgi:hypothetical protein